MQESDELRVAEKPAPGDALKTGPQRQSGAAGKQSVTAYRLRRMLRRVIRPRAAFGDRPLSSYLSLALIRAF